LTFLFLLSIFPPRIFLIIFLKGDEVKKFALVLLPVLTLGFLSGCEDKAAEELQNQNISAVTEETSKISREIEELKRENAQMKQSLGMISAYIRKKESSAKVDQPAPKTTKAAPTTKKKTSTP